MSESPPSFFSRIAIAFRVFLRCLSDGAFAATVERVGGTPSAPKAPAPTLRDTGPDSALQLLGLLQREGRLVDFLEEDLTGFSDTQVGAAVRVVHEGCRKVVREHFTLAPVRGEAEGVRVTLARGFDASATRVVGNVVGEPPFAGTLTHRGWRAEQVRLPRVAPGHDLRLIAPAEVEL
jgi:hypothetical protein